MYVDDVSYCCMLLIGHKLTSYITVSSVAMVTRWLPCLFVVAALSLGRFVDVPIFYFHIERKQCIQFSIECTPDLSVNSFENQWILY